MTDERPTAHIDCELELLGLPVDAAPEGQAVVLVRLVLDVQLDLDFVAVRTADGSLVDVRVGTDGRLETDGAYRV